MKKVIYIVASILLISLADNCSDKPKEKEVLRDMNPRVNTHYEIDIDGSIGEYSNDRIDTTYLNKKEEDKSY